MRALQNRDLEAAALDCAAALKASPSAAHIWDSYALVAFRSGDFVEARKRYDKTLALNPKLAPSLYARGITRLRLGDATGGRADIAAAQAISPDVDRVLTEVGIAP